MPDTCAKEVCCKGVVELETIWIEGGTLGSADSQYFKNISTRLGKQLILRSSKHEAF